MKSGDFPKEIRRFLWEEGVAHRHPAVVVCDTDNRVVRTRGDLTVFGISNLKEGVGLVEQAPVFIGLAISVDQGPQHFPFLQTGSSLVADLFAVPVGPEIWYLLLDTTREAEFQRRRQHVSHERELKRREVDVAEEGLAAGDPLAALAAFDALVLERTHGGHLLRVGDIPRWLRTVWPDVVGSGHYFDAGVSPFLEHFLSDAEEAWWTGEGVTLPSGVFIETDGHGIDWHLEATAVQSRGRSLLIVQEVGKAQREKFELLQRARDKALERHRMLKEIELKDVLLHCVIHDLSSPLSATIMTLEAIEGEKLSDRARELIEMTFAQLERQNLLIQMILDVFSADSAGAIGSEGTVTGSEVVDCIDDVRRTVEPLAAARDISFRVDVAALHADTIMRGERLRLSRVIANLVDNARRHTGTGNQIAVTVRTDENDVFFSVEDDGPGVSSEIEGKLFDRFAQAGAGKGTAGLGLHFCRITVEAWGGTIGHDRGDHGRSRFWFRIPVVRGTTDSNA